MSGGLPPRLLGAVRTLYQCRRGIRQTLKPLRDLKSRFAGGVLDAWARHCATLEAVDLRKRVLDGRVVFDGRKNLERRQKGLIGPRDWKRARLRSMIIRDDKQYAGNRPGNEDGRSWTFTIPEGGRVKGQVMVQRSLAPGLPQMTATPARWYQTRATASPTIGLLGRRTALASRQTFDVGSVLLLHRRILLVRARAWRLDNSCCLAGPLCRHLSSARSERRTRPASWSEQMRRGRTAPSKDQRARNGPHGESSSEGIRKRGLQLPSTRTSRCLAHSYHWRRGRSSLRCTISGQHRPGIWEGGACLSLFSPQRPPWPAPRSGRVAPPIRQRKDARCRRRNSGRCRFG